VENRKPVMRRCGWSQALSGLLLFTGAFLVASSITSVHPCMTAHVATHTEGTPTAFKTADKRSLSSVNIKVDPETARSSEPLAAIHTLVQARPTRWNRRLVGYLR